VATLSMSSLVAPTLKITTRSPKNLKRAEKTLTYRISSSSSLLLLTEYYLDDESPLGHFLGDQRQFELELVRNWPWRDRRRRLILPICPGKKGILQPNEATNDMMAAMKRHMTTIVDNLKTKKIVHEDARKCLQIRADFSHNPHSGRVCLNEFDLVPLAHSFVDDCKYDTCIGAMVDTMYERLKVFSRHKMQPEP